MVIKRRQIDWVAVFFILKIKPEFAFELDSSTGCRLSNFDDDAITLVLGLSVFEIEMLKNGDPDM